MPNANRRDCWRHPSLAFLFPATLAALGAWQVTRVAGGADEFAARAGRVEASIERLQPLATRDPGAVVRFNNNSRSYTASEALTLMRDARTGLRRDAMIERARQVAAWATVGGGRLVPRGGLDASQAGEGGPVPGRGRRGVSAASG